MEKWKMRSVELMTSLIFGGRERVSVVPYYPQKTAVSGREERFFKRTTPERVGISSKRIYNMLCQLEAEKRANIHGIAVLRRGRVICECYAPGYDGQTWHIAHSMSKTVTGMVIGRLCDEGMLSTDMRLVDIFPEIIPKDKKFYKITLEHLLTMTSGVEFSEPGSVTESEWTAAFFSSLVKFLPGTKFAYNSMNSYMLARIAERVSGRRFITLAEEYIFAPLGIKEYLWEKGPEETEKGGWGLYLSSESWLKIGYMVLMGGEFFGKRILSREWVRNSTTMKAVAPEENGNFNYAYQLWVGRHSEEYLFSGMLGQNLWICPRNELVVVINSGNNELFQASPALEIVRKFLGGRMADQLNPRNFRRLDAKEKDFFDRRRRVRPLERSSGLLYRLGIRQPEPFDTPWSNILGRYAVGNNGVGVMPLVVRIMQNSLDSQIEEIGFRREGGELVFCFTESGESFDVPIGFYGYKESVIKMRGESYIVRAIGRQCDGAGGRKYEIELVFPETASTRRITIRTYRRGVIALSFSESPGERLAVELLSSYTKSSRALGLTVELLERRFGKGVVAETIRKTFNPTLVCADISAEGYERVIEEENKRATDRQKKLKFVNDVVDRFFKESLSERM